MIQHTGMKVSAPLMLMLTAGDVAAIALRATVDESCGGMEGMWPFQGIEKTGGAKGPPPRRTRCIISTCFLLLFWQKFELVQATTTNGNSVLNRAQTEAGLPSYLCYNFCM